MPFVVIVPASVLTSAPALPDCLACSAAVARTAEQTVAAAGVSSCLLVAVADAVAAELVAAAVATSFASASFASLAVAEVSFPVDSSPRSHPHFA